MAFRAELTDFAAFYERTYQRAFRTARAIVHDPEWAADLAQQAYVQAYRRRGAFRGEAPAEAWLHRIVINVTLSAIRSRRTPEPGSVHWLDPAATRPAADAAPTGDRLDLLAALQTLDPRSRAAVVLRYYLDDDYATIARILGTSEGNVGSILSRSLERLRSTLAADGADRADGTTSTGAVKGAST